MSQQHIKANSFTCSLAWQKEMRLKKQSTFFGYPSPLLLLRDKWQTQFTNEWMHILNEQMSESMIDLAKDSPLLLLRDRWQTEWMDEWLNEQMSEWMLDRSIVHRTLLSGVVVLPCLSLSVCLSVCCLSLSVWLSVCCLSLSLSVCLLSLSLCLLSLSLCLLSGSAAPQCCPVCLSLSVCLPSGSAAPQCFRAGLCVSLSSNLTAVS